MLLHPAECPRTVRTIFDSAFAGRGELDTSQAYQVICLTLGLLCNSIIPWLE